MNSFKHWTPRYIYDRIRTFCYENAYPENPWLTRQANEILDSYLTRSDIGLEFGSGRSTIWLAKRVAHLTSVEHDENWARRVREMLKKEKIGNVDLKFFPKDVEDHNGKDAAYVKVVDNFGDRSLDFCLIDGVYREFCALGVVEKIHPGGLLILDNANRYLTHPSRSPNSRNPGDGLKGVEWNGVAKVLSGWRKIWTSSGVIDTALFFKPCPKIEK